MKKFARVMALVLVGAMLLMMTACCGKPVTKEDILAEINAYRQEVNMEPLKEVEVLSQREKAYVDMFAAAGKTSIDLKKVDTTEYDKIDEAVSKDWQIVWANGSVNTGKDENVAKLFMPAKSLEQVYEQICVSAMFNDDWADSIGIATVTIDGVTYWSFSTFYAK